jgi:hypothetical protein
VDCSDIRRGWQSSHCIASVSRTTEAPSRLPLHKATDAGLLAGSRNGKSSELPAPMTMRRSERQHRRPLGSDSPKSVARSIPLRSAVLYRTYPVRGLFRVCRPKIQRSFSVTHSAADIHAKSTRRRRPPLSHRGTPDRDGFSRSADRADSAGLGAKAPVSMRFPNPCSGYPPTALSRCAARLRPDWSMRRASFRISFRSLSFWRQPVSI